MEMKRSKQLIFYKDGSRVYAKIDHNLTVYLMPLIPAYGVKVNKIWNNAEHIEDYAELISWCNGGETIRPVATSRRF